MHTMGGKERNIYSKINLDIYTMKGVKSYTYVKINSLYIFVAFRHVFNYAYTAGDNQILHKPGHIRFLTDFTTKLFYKLQAYKGHMN